LNCRLRVLANSGFSAVLDRKWPLDRAGRHKLYRRGHGACRSDLQLGSVSKHHPDAMTSIARFHFNQSREINLTIFLIVRYSLDYFDLQTENQALLI
jgi:hypothetical protein